MSNIWIEEHFINKTRGYRFGDTEIHDSGEDNVGKLFKALAREYGRCATKVYTTARGKDIPVGWVFEKKMQYEGSRREDDTYIREVWVSCYSEPVGETIRYLEVK